MNRPVPPRDRGDRRADPPRASRPSGFVPGAGGLVDRVEDPAGRTKRAAGRRAGGGKLMRPQSLSFDFSNGCVLAAIAPRPDQIPGRAHGIAPLLEARHPATHIGGRYFASLADRRHRSDRLVRSVFGFGDQKADSKIRRFPDHSLSSVRGDHVFLLADTFMAQTGKTIKRKSSLVTRRAAGLIP